ncbi:hypothetical protein Tco_1260849 [Tanacetum coccineum]
MDFFDLWKLGSPLDAVEEGLMINMQNEGSIYTFRTCYNEMMGEPLNSSNANGETIVMKSFPCLTETFGTPNTSTKVDSDGPNLSNKGDDGSKKVIRSDKLNGMKPVSYSNLLNG